MTPEFKIGDVIFGCTQYGQRKVIIVSEFKESPDGPIPFGWTKEGTGHCLFSHISRAKVLIPESKLIHCYHQWKSYQGLTEAYSYCTVCDSKKEGL